MSCRSEAGLVSHLDRQEAAFNSLHYARFDRMQLWVPFTTPAFEFLPENTNIASITTGAFSSSDSVKLRSYPFLRRFCWGTWVGMKRECKYQELVVMALLGFEVRLSLASRPHSFCEGSSILILRPLPLCLIVVSQGMLM